MQSIMKTPEKYKEHFKSGVFFVFFFELGKFHFLKYQKFIRVSVSRNHGNIITQGMLSLFPSVKFLSFFNDSF